MILPPLIAAIVDFIVIFPMAYTPIVLLLCTRFLPRFSKLLNMKVLIFFIMVWVGFCVEQIIVGQTRQYWAWMIGYLFFALVILLYTRRKKGFDNITSFRLAVYSIWAASLIKELVGYIKGNLIGKFLSMIIIEKQLFNMDWMVWGFHISCIISGVLFFLILVRLGWRPSKKWIMLFIICFLFELLIIEPVWRAKAITSLIVNFHRLPWFILMLLAVAESPKKQKERRDKKSF